MAALRVALSRRFRPALLSKKGRGAEADCCVPAVLAGATLTGVGVAWLWLRDGSRELPVVQARIREANELRYLCEGQSHLLCAGVNSTGSGRALQRGAWSCHLLQLQKVGPHDGQAASFQQQALLQRMLASHCFDARFVSVPQVVALPIKDVRAVDAHILASRPAKQRQQRLSIDDSPEHPGKVLALRMENLFECLGPSLTLELHPGCGIQEVEGLPSRHAMEQQLAGDGAGDLPLEVFSGDTKRCTAALVAALGGNSALQTKVFSSGGEAVLTESLHEALAAVGFPSSPEQLAAAAAAVLSFVPASQHALLKDLLGLQAFAAGNCEKLAPQLLSELRSYGGEAAVAALADQRQLELAVRHAAHGHAKLDAVTMQESEAYRLLSLTKWGNREVAAAQRWLMLFLMGRGAFGAKVMLTFVHATEGSPEQKRLCEGRFMSLAECLPGESWASKIWVCATVVGLCPSDAAEINSCSTHLEDLEAKYRDVIVK
eukprot:TRINITY_DN65343_c0_g1_i1.p1 TRINITY_DN65343_c0_g1~~TRINITY_DN65343_c0_g1_i1.p1  ORF type:complete len:498 (-),score=126.31 TRINITY_DN65343_c0_g1_i1:28-1494(-)